MGDISAHFDRREFDCPDGQIAHPDPRLLVCLEHLRSIVSARYGRQTPLRIVSGYRDAAYNARVGGAKDSQHLYNRAADIPAGYCTIAEAEQAGFTGIGHNHGRVVHVDVRASARVVFQDPA